MPISSEITVVGTTKISSPHGKSKVSFVTWTGVKSLWKNMTVSSSDPSDLLSSVSQDTSWLIKRFHVDPGEHIPSELRSDIDRRLLKGGRALYHLDVFVFRGWDCVNDLEEITSVKDIAFKDVAMSGLSWRYSIPFKTPWYRRPVYLSTGIDYNEIRKWLEICDHNHADCRKECTKLDMSLMLNLIDCERGVVVPAGEQQDYVALSYVWGRTAIDARSMRKFNPKKLPLTIRDSIRVVLGLGMRYLWVDRYCIDQTSKHLKHQVVCNMDSVYQRASLTIVAAAGRNAEHGLPGVSEVFRQLQHENDISTGPCLILQGPGAEIDQSIWSTRGWTYQEGRLSRRCLVFTPTQTTLFCATGSFREKHGHQYGLNRFSKKVSGVEIFNLINEYVTRDLQFPSDSLKAFLGVMRQHEKLRLFPTTHVWGLPLFGPADPKSDYLVHSLLWSCQYSNLTRIPELPSWTWAGWRGFQKGYVGPYTTNNLWKWGFDVHDDGSTDAVTDLLVQVNYNGDRMSVSDYFDVQITAGPNSKAEPDKRLFISGWTVEARIEDILTLDTCLWDSSRYVREHKEQIGSTGLTLLLVSWPQQKSTTAQWVFIVLEKQFKRYSSPCYRLGILRWPDGWHFRRGPSEAKFFGRDFIRREIIIL